MPYSSIKDLPVHLKKYSDVVKRQWLHVFNTVYTQTDGNEARAFKAANSVLKKRFAKKEQTWNKNEPDYINHLIDRFLGNLPG